MSLNKLYRWVQTILDLPSRDRLKIVNTTLAGLRDEGLEQTDELVAAVKDGRLEFVGIAPEVRYLRVKGDAQDLDSIWVHRFGTPKLLYKVHGAPILIITGSKLKLNESDVLELNGRNREVKGLTG